MARTGSSICQNTTKYRYIQSNLNGVPFIDRKSGIWGIYLVTHHVSFMNHYCRRQGWVSTTESEEGRTPSRTCLECLDPVVSNPFSLHCSLRPSFLSTVSDHAIVRRVPLSVKMTVFPTEIPPGVPTLISFKLVV